MTKAEEAKLAATEQRALDAEATNAALVKENETKDGTIAGLRSALDASDGELVKRINDFAELEKSVSTLTGRVDELHKANETLTEEARLARETRDVMNDAARDAELKVDELEQELTLVKLQRDEANERANRAASTKDTSTLDLPLGLRSNAMMGDVAHAMVTAVMAATGLDEKTASERITRAGLEVEASLLAEERAERESKGVLT